MSRRVPELDLLRFFAAFSVLVFHYDILVPAGVGAQPILHAVARFGFLGVPLFFMISGFVILWTAFNKSAWEFVLARFSRLYPSYWVCVLITSAVLSLAAEPPHWKQVLANLTMFQHLLGFPSVDQVYWTLFVELKFYALVLVLLIFRQLPVIERWLFLWLALCAGSLLASRWHPGPIPSVDTVVFEGSSAYFAYGCYAYLIRMQGPSVLRWIGLGTSGLLSVVASLRFQEHYMHASDWSTLLQVACMTSALVLIVLAVALRRLRLPESRWWYALGTLTYPLYLLHAIAGKTFYSMLPPAWNLWARLTIMLIAVLAVASVLAFTIERHLCNALYRWLRDSRPRATEAPSEASANAVRVA
jgi:peptidoglycan/LPS O-acetylase OafA/YrhL